MARKPTDYVQFKLRIRQSLVKQIQKEAAKKKHSANNEAVERLEKSFAHEAQDLRDSAIIDMLLDQKRGSSDVLRTMASWLAKHPDWSHSKVNVKDVIERIFTAHGEETVEEPGPGDKE